jgi:hypothetical protein
VSTAEELAAGLKASMAINALQTALTEESFLLLKALISDHIRTEVAAAIRQERQRGGRARSAIQPVPLKGMRK